MKKMKSEKLQNAIGMVDEELIVRAEQPPKKQTKKQKIMKWTTPIAAVLVLAIGIGIFFGNQSPFILKAYAVAEAEYPEMADFSGLGFGSAYDKWREDQKKQREYRGAGENLDNFIGKTLTEILSGSENENRVYSPLNVYMALAMLAEITDGESRNQILTLLDAENIDALRTQAHAVWNANYNDDGAYTNILASSLWLNQDIEYKETAINNMVNYYYASVFSGEMGSADYDKALRAWLNEQTHGLLSDQIDRIEMTPETIITLATTIYFQDKWSDEFSKGNNTKDTFHGANGDQTVTFMNEKMTYGTYFWGEKFSATRKNLKKSGSMYFILPDEGISIDELLSDEQALNFILNCSSDTKLWKAFENNRKEMIVNLSLPKFDIDSNFELSQSLKNLGITDCFDFGRSDFSPLCDKEETPIAISHVNHGVRVAIDEEGVTATAYVEMPGAGSAMPPEDEIDFVVDRPFIFVIAGNDGLPLFIGIVNTI